MVFKELEPHHETTCKLCGTPAAHRFNQVTTDRVIADPNLRYEPSENPPSVTAFDNLGNVVGRMNFGWVEASLCDNCAKKTPDEIVAELG
jgi:hypothetical protein